MVLPLSPDTLAQGQGTSREKPRQAELELIGCKEYLVSAKGTPRRPLPARAGGTGHHLCSCPPAPHWLLAQLTWMPFSCRFRYRVLTGMLAGTSASSLRVQITRLAWLLQEQAAGQEVAGGEPPPAANVMATPPPPAPRGGEKSQRKSRAPWGQDILPGGSGGHGELRAHAILNVHAPRGCRGAVGGRERERLSEGQGPRVACLLPNPQVALCHRRHHLPAPLRTQRAGLPQPPGGLTHLLRAAETRASPAIPALPQVIPDRKIIPISQN